jgi:hypothetical protein
MALRCDDRPLSTPDQAQSAGLARVVNPVGGISHDLPANGPVDYVRDVLIDLHVHYPMRVVSDATPRIPPRLAGRRATAYTLGDRLRALFLRVLSNVFSHRSPLTGYRVTPKSRYFQNLLKDLEQVEEEVSSHSRGLVRVVVDRNGLDQALEDRATALGHCLEGGFSLGDRPEEIAANVAELRRQGVVCGRRSPSRTHSCMISFEQIDAIAKVTGGHKHVAIGADFDGFIEPTMTGLEGMKDLDKLERALDEHYGADAVKIKSGNALRVPRAVLA